MWYWLVDLIIPLFTAGLGALTKRRPPQFGKTILYRSKRSKTSAKTWDYANRRLGEFWFKIGAVMAACVILHRVFSALPPMYTTAINIAASFAGFVAAYPLVERELAKKFDGEGNGIETPPDATHS